MHSQGNHKQNEKTTYRMGENICKVTEKRLTSKIYKQLIQLNNKKPTNYSRSGQKTYTDTSPKKTYRWPINT